MHKLVYMSGMALFLGTLLVPFTASALGISFGGRILALYPACLNGGIWVSELSARSIDPGVPEEYIWVPGFTFSTPPLPGPPPLHPGQEILGVADIPYLCVVSYVPFFALPGLRMQVENVSI